MKYPEFKLESYLGAREFVAPHNFCASDLESHSMADILQLADEEGRQLWEQLGLHYTEPNGLPLLREEIAQNYGDAITANHILCFAGAEEGIYCAAQALLEPSDHAIVITPCYQSLESLPASICATTRITLEYHKQWKLDLELLESAIRPNTRLLLINFPHNPTGTLISSEEQARLVQLARKHDLWIFSDEVYRLLELDPEDRLPAIASIYEKGLSLGVMSKSYGLAGLRVGWIACQDQEVLRQMGEVKHYLSICNSAPSEVLALIALRAGETILQRNTDLMRKNLARLDTFFLEYCDWFEWVRPKGGCIGYPLLKADMSIAAFADDLLEETGVLILPGSVYDQTENHFRISFGRASMPKVLARFQEYIERTKGKWKVSQ